MTHWITISRNAARHGDFAGRSQREQDAYFEFFAGADTTNSDTFRMFVSQIVQRTSNLAPLQWVSSRLACRPVRSKT